MRLNESQLADWALPPRFEIHTACNSCREWVIAVGRCDGDVWVSTELMAPDNAERYPDGSLSQFRARVESLKR